MCYICPSHCFIELEMINTSHYITSHVTSLHHFAHCTITTPLSDLVWLRISLISVILNGKRDDFQGKMMLQRGLIVPWLRINCPMLGFIRRHGAFVALRWRHNEHGGVSNHQPHDCYPKRLFKRRSKKSSKLRVTGLCGGNSPVTGEFPAQRASNAENVSIWWRHQGRVFYVWLSKVSAK